MNPFSTATGFFQLTKQYEATYKAADNYIESTLVETDNDESDLDLYEDNDVTENDRQIVIVAHLDDEQCVESTNEKFNELKIRFNKHLKTIPELYSQDDDHDSEYIDGFRMKCRFIKSNHMLLFTNEQDRLIEITEATRRQSYIDVHKHYRIDLFDLYILSIRLIHKSMSLNDWWIAYKTFVTTSNINSKEKQIQLLRNYSHIL
ncbi:unnamed protein product [Rotaria sp. Silwood1]|nr:unnamed protein product [Rotaria sp. Silwood1]